MGAIQQILSAVTPTGIGMVSYSHNYSSSGTTLTVGKPTGVLDGDILFAFMNGTNGDFTWTGDSGWTESIDQGVLPSFRVAYKVASSEGASYNFTVSGSAVTRGIIIAFRAAALDIIGDLSAVSHPTVTAASITVTDDNSILMACFSTSGGEPVPSAPAGMTGIDVYSSLAVFYQVVNSGATGDKVSTVADVSNSVGILISVKSA
jgi:hypothetical protein